MWNAPCRLDPYLASRRCAERANSHVRIVARIVGRNPDSKVSCFATTHIAAGRVVPETTSPAVSTNDRAKGSEGNVVGEVTMPPKTQNPSATIKSQSRGRRVRGWAFRSNANQSGPKPTKNTMSRPGAENARFWKVVASESPRSVHALMTATVSKIACDNNTTVKTTKQPRERPTSVVPKPLAQTHRSSCSRFDPS